MSTIAQIVQHLRPGGIETMALDLMAFCEKNDKTIIISLEGDKKSAINNWPRLQKIAEKIIFLDKEPGLKPLLILNLIKIFKKYNVDTVHTHHIGPLVYAGIATRLCKIKHLIHTEHDAWHLNDLWRRSLQRGIIYLTQPLLVADAKTVADKIQFFLKLNNVHIINNGIDTERFTPGDKKSSRKNLGLPLNVKLIGCSGRLEKVKGQKDLINALTQLPETIHLALAGTGSIEVELRHMANQLNLNKRVHFLGRIDEMPIFYRCLDVFCLPSLNEGYPLSPLEAQACGIPTVVTDVGGAKETLCPVSGKLVPANNIQIMVSTLEKMLYFKLKNSNKNPRNFVQAHGDVRHMSRAYHNLSSCKV